MRTKNSLRFVLLTLLLAANHSVSAATIQVNRPDDVADPQPADGVCNVEILNVIPQCTLRAAIQTANAMAGPDTVQLSVGGIYQLNLLGAGGAEAGDIDVSDDLSLLGFAGEPPANAADLPLIDAAGLNDRILRIAPGVTLAVRGLRLRGGHAVLGGAVYNQGNFSVDHSIFDYQQADWGAAIFSSGDGLLRVTNSHFEHNRSLASGGAIAASSVVEVQRSSFRDNRGNDIDGATISVEAGALVISDSSFDGEPLGPPIAGLGTPNGIAYFGDLLTIRNSTLTGFSGQGVYFSGLGSEPGIPRVRIANSILATAPGGTACVALGPDPGAADVLIAYSMVQSNSGCSTFYSDVSLNSPQLDPSSQDDGRVTWSRGPQGVFSNLTDNGIPPERTAPANAPELACTATDQRGNTRPVDGNGDDIARCDLGAVEAGEPPTFIVDTPFDEVDDVPGDGLCESLSMQCSLRAAVMEANALAGVQRIRFAAGLDPIELILPPHPAAAGGDLDLSDGLIISGDRVDGQPATKITQSAPGERLFDIPPGASGSVLLRNLQLSGGDSGAEFGGALRVMDGEVIVQWSRFSENHSPFAGGAVAVQAGYLALFDSDLHDNSAGERGTALFVGSGATLGIQRSSIWNNSGFDGDVPLAAVQGEAGSALALLDSTVASNSAGVLVESPSILMLISSTIANHVGVGLTAVLSPGDDLIMASSIIAGNGFNAAMAEGGVGGSDCAFTDLELGNLLAHAHLLSSDGSCTAGSPTSFFADPLLGELAPVPGHPSRVLRPRYDDEAASPALDVSPAESCDRPDQIGQSRPVDLPDYENVNGPCDLGAVERQSEQLFRHGFEASGAVKRSAVDNSQSWMDAAQLRFPYLLR